MAEADEALRVRWLGRVAYRDGLALQRALVDDHHDHLLLLEHPHTITTSRRTPPEHLLLDEAAVAALGGEVVETDRGGDITYHGPGQLVGYPVLTLPGRRGGGMADTAAYVHGLEQVLIDSLARIGAAKLAALEAEDDPEDDPEPPATTPGRVRVRRVLGGVVLVVAARRTPAPRTAAAPRRPPPPSSPGRRGTWSPRC